MDMVRQELMLKQLLHTRMLRTKSLDELLSPGLSRTLPGDAAPQHQLKRTLGAFDVTMLGIGAIVGAGIFATIGTAAAGDPTRPAAGPAMMSFLLVAICCAFAALCYSELASMIPVAGSAYTYAYATLGRDLAWIIGWDLILEYAVGNVAVASSWSGYFVKLCVSLSGCEAAALGGRPTHDRARAIRQGGGRSPPARRTLSGLPDRAAISPPSRSSCCSRGSSSRHQRERGLNTAMVIFKIDDRRLLHRRSAPSR